MDNAFTYDNKNWSNINVFTYLNPLDITPDEEEDEDEDPISQNQIDCYTNCNVDIPTNSSPYELEAVEYFDIGHFRIFDVEVEEALGDGVFKGKGLVDFPLMNGVNLKVTFNDVKLNTDAQAISGTVRGEQTEEEVSEVPTILNDILRTSRLAAGFIGLSTKCDLPLGIDYPIAGNKVLLAVKDLTLTPESGRTNITSAFQIKAMNEESWLSFSATDQCVHPGGFAGETILYLEENLDTAPENENQLSIAFNGLNTPGEESIQQAASYIKMDCNGMKQIALEAKVLIPQGKLIPEDENGLPAEGRVEGTMSVIMDRLVEEENNVYAQVGEQEVETADSKINFIGSMTLDSFQIKGLCGWGFYVVDAYIDASEISNIPDMVVPQDVDYMEGYTSNLWTGFYLREISLKLPKEMTVGEGRMEVSVNDAFLEPALTARFEVGDGIFNIDEGKVDKCKMSMNELYLEIVQGDFVEAGFSGIINIPIAGDADTLSYTAAIQQTTIEEETDIESDEDYDTYDDIEDCDDCEEEDEYE